MRNRRLREPRNNFRSHELGQIMKSSCCRCSSCCAFMRGIRLSMAPNNPANSKPTQKELAGSARASDAQTACDKEAATKVIRCRERQLYEKVRQGRDRHLAAKPTV